MFVLDKNIAILLLCRVYVNLMGLVDVVQGNSLENVNNISSLSANNNIIVSSATALLHGEHDIFA